MTKFVSAVSAMGLLGVLLAGCASGQATTSEPTTAASSTTACEQLHNEDTCVPATDAEVIALVRSRYADCLSQLTETEDPIYARDDEGQLLPGQLLFVGSDWAVMIGVSELSEDNSIFTFPDSGKSTDILTSVGCEANRNADS